MLQSGLSGGQVTSYANRSSLGSLADVGADFEPDRRRFELPLEVISFAAPMNSVYPCATIRLDIAWLNSLNWYSHMFMDYRQALEVLR